MTFFFCWDLCPLGVVRIKLICLQKKETNFFKEFEWKVGFFFCRFIWYILFSVKNLYQWKVLNFPQFWINYKLNEYFNFFFFFNIALGYLLSKKSSSCNFMSLQKYLNLHFQIINESEKFLIISIIFTLNIIKTWEYI